MRSNIGTKARLGAHIVALVGLILMLVYIRPPERVRPAAPPPEPPTAVAAAPAPVTPAPIPAPDPAATLDRVQTPVTATQTPAEQLRPPVDGAAQAAAPARDLPGIAARPPETGTLAEGTPLQPASEPVRPPETEPAAPAVVEPAEPEEPPVADVPAEIVAETVPEPQPEPPVETPVEPEQESAAAVPTEPEAEPSAPVEPEPAPEAEPAPAVSEEPAAAEEPPAQQPDESGALVVAENEAEAGQPVAAATPLANAHLEVLGDGVYWLDHRYDMEKELAAVPEIGRLILLTPLPGYRNHMFENVDTEVIPADAADLSRESAERFLFLTSGSRKPVVAAMLPGARGAAFFKGAYLLVGRNLGIEETLREIEPELEEAGGARDEIVHRLMRLRD